MSAGLAESGTGNKRDSQCNLCASPSDRITQEQTAPGPLLPWGERQTAPEIRGRS